MTCNDYKKSCIHVFGKITLNCPVLVASFPKNVISNNITDQCTQMNGFYSNYREIFKNHNFELPKV